MDLPLWTIIPAMFFLTLIYLGLGNSGYWNYSPNDFIYGNIFVIFSIGIFYGGELVYNKINK